MTSETFGFYVAIIYITKGVELLGQSTWHFILRRLPKANNVASALTVFEFEDSTTAGGWLAVTIAMLFALTVYFVQRTGSLPFGPFWLRKLLSDYAFAFAAIWWTGFSHMCVRAARYPLISGFEDSAEPDCDNQPRRNHLGRPAIPPYHAVLLPEHVSQLVYPLLGAAGTLDRRFHPLRFSPHAPLLF